MNIKCKNGEAHTHENVAQARACWLGAPAAPVATLAQPTTGHRVAMAVDARENGAEDMASPARGGHHSHVQVPDGRYAVTLAGEDTLRFFRVKAGHKTGVVFVDEQASDDMWPVRDRARRVAILAAIASDPAAAGVRYGQALGVCGVCGRTLTDEASRAAGIGPVCAAR
jgi:hypothetical protein